MIKLDYFKLSPGCCFLKEKKEANLHFFLYRCMMTTSLCSAIIRSAIMFFYINHVCILKVDILSLVLLVSSEAPVC
jgi:hypothetical protein